MTLTAGTTLQDGKYVIQAVLNQSEFGITYQAAHIYLDESVIIQTLGSKPSDFKKEMWLQQKFLAGVRRLAKGSHPYPGRVLDFFTERRMPYVVLEYVPEHPLPDILDWLLSPKSEASQENDLNDLEDALPVESSSMSTELGDTELSEAAIAPSDSPIPALHQADVNPAIDSGTATALTANALTTDALTADAVTTDGTSHVTSPDDDPASNGFVTHTTATHATAPDAPSNGATVVVSHPGSMGRSPSVKRRNRNLWLPLSLVFTTAIAGLAGAGFGWTLRFHPATPSRSRINIFQNEQSFPPTEGWPIQEEGSDRTYSTSDWERPVDRSYDAPIPEYRPIPEAAPAEVDPIEEDKVILEDPLPKAPTEFEGSDPLVTDPAPVPAPSENPVTPPSVNSGSAPPVEPAPAPAVDVQPPPAPVAPDPIVPPSPPPQ